MVKSMGVKQTIRVGIRSLIFRLSDPWRYTTKHTRIVRNFESLKIALNWQHDPAVDKNEVDVFERASDINHRRYLDALVIAGACRNNPTGNFLEIGTAYGETTALMARNAPDSKIYTINIPPEEMDSGGRLTTFALSKDDIGRIYRKEGHNNVHQILANTATWKPDLPTIDMAFIDGCHDAEFVYNDTLKALQAAKPGTVIIWHDFNPELANRYSHIAEVMTGINWLIKKKHIRGPIYHLQDTFTGIHVIR